MGVLVENTESVLDALLLEDAQSPQTAKSRTAANALEIVIPSNWSTISTCDRGSNFGN